MTLQSLKQLESLIKICKKHGVESIEIDNIKMNISLLHSSSQKTKESILMPNGITDQTIIPTPNMPTAEELLYWSSEGQSETQ